jgi:flagellar secretion chaperone FliS
MLCQLQKTYLEAEVLTASPVRLIEILFELGISTIESARECCRNGDILGRGQLVTKGVEILAELTNSLDFEAGGDLAKNYARLYDYCQRRLLEAHTRQSEPMLEEVQSLLRELREAWQAVVTTCTPRCLSEDELLADHSLVSTGEPRFSCLG